jgi:hypothetical protein
MLEFQEVIEFSEMIKIQSRQTKKVIGKFPKAYPKI